MDNLLITNKALAMAYLNAAGEKQLDRVANLLHPGIAFAGPIMSFNKVENYISALLKLGTIQLGYDVKRVFAEGDEVCAIYDLLTDTPVGAIPCVEWINIHNGKIISIQLMFDRYRWPEVMAEMGKRSSEK